MKKLAILLFVFAISFANVGRSENYTLGEISISLDGNTKYKLTLESIFSEVALPKVEKMLEENYAPFKILSVDCNAKTMIIQTTSKVPFDDVKQALDKLGYRIVKHEEIKSN